MIQRFRHASANLGSRRWLAVLTIFWLNLALLPCAMAFESSSEPEHDCCPPSIELTMPADCCELDALSSDKRDVEDAKDVALVATASPLTNLSVCAARMPQKLRPPIDAHPPPLHLLHCVFLK